MNLEDILLYSKMTEEEKLNYIKKNKKLIGQINKVAIDGLLPINIAIRNRYSLIVKFFIMNGVNCNLQDRNGNTPLIIAITNDNNLEIDRLLKLGADPLIENKRGESPMSIAYQRKDMDLVVLLDSFRNGIVPLLTGVYYETDTLILQVRKYIEMGVDINKKDKHGNTALMYAVLGNFVNVSGILLEAGADATIKNKYGVSPFKQALTYNNKEVIKLLTYYLSNPNYLKRKEMYKRREHYSEVENVIIDESEIKLILK